MHIGDRVKLTRPPFWRGVIAMAQDRLDGSEPDYFLRWLWKPEEYISRKAYPGRALMEVHDETA